MMMLMLLVAAALLIYGFSKSSDDRQIYGKFGLSASAFKLISTDLGKRKSSIRLSRYGINGIPDAVFEAKGEPLIIVGEFKSRRYKQVVRLYEFYQLTLYLGHIQRLYPNHSVQGALAYADRVVVIEFDKAVYSGLLGMSKEMRSSMASKKIVSSEPLHKRIKINNANRSIKFSVQQ